MSYTISENTRNYERFMLFADNDQATAVNASIELPLTCPFIWFFAPKPPVCPQDPPTESAAAEQEFEHGWMVWIGATKQIYVIFNDTGFYPRWTAFADTWEDGMPIDDPTIIVPPGYYQPKRGFGLIWREEPSVRDRLGWAVVEEAGYAASLQRTSYARYNEIYIRAYDGEIWKLLPEQSGWEKFPDEK